MMCLYDYHSTALFQNEPMYFTQYNLMILRNRKLPFTWDFLTFIKN